MVDDDSICIELLDMFCCEELESISLLEESASELS